MSALLSRRLARLEGVGRPLPSWVVSLRDDQWSPEATAAAIEAHCEATGHAGAVLLAPIPCETAAEWRSRYGGPA